VVFSFFVRQYLHHTHPRAPSTVRRPPAKVTLPDLPPASPVAPLFAGWDGEAVASTAYTLTAMVQHMGSASSGHYVARCRHPLTGQWHLFDDHHVSRALNPATDVANAEAYILLYTRKPQPNSALAAAHALLLRRAAAAALADSKVLQPNTLAQIAAAFSAYSLPVTDASERAFVLRIVARAVDAAAAAGGARASDSFFLSRTWVTKALTFARVPPVDNRDLCCVHGVPLTLRASSPATAAAARARLLQASRRAGVPLTATAENENASASARRLPVAPAAWHTADFAQDFAEHAAAVVAALKAASSATAAGRAEAGAGSGSGSSSQRTRSPHRGAAADAATAALALSALPPLPSPQDLANDVLSAQSQQQQQQQQQSDLEARAIRVSGAAWRELVARYGGGPEVTGAPLPPLPGSGPSASATAAASATASLTANSDSGAMWLRNAIAVSLSPSSPILALPPSNIVPSQALLAASPPLASTTTKSPLPGPTPSQSSRSNSGGGASASARAPPLPGGCALLTFSGACARCALPRLAAAETYLVKVVSRLIPTDDNDPYMLITRDWLVRWRAFVGSNGVAPRPGPIDNTPLLRISPASSATGEGDGAAMTLRAREGLEINHDYKTLAPASFYALLGVYGGGPVIMRSQGNLYAGGDIDGRWYSLHTGLPLTSAVGGSNPSGNPSRGSNPYRSALGDANDDPAEDYNDGDDNDDGDEEEDEELSGDKPQRLWRSARRLVRAMEQDLADVAARAAPLL